MNELLELIIKEAMNDAIKNGINASSNNYNKSEELSFQESDMIAKSNYMLFKSHLAAGFTEEQAMQIVVAINN